MNQKIENESMGDNFLKFLKIAATNITQSRAGSHLRTPLANQLAVKSVLSIIEHRELVVIGEGADLFVEPVPPSLAGKTLVESAIGAKTGLNVIAVEHGDKTSTNPPPTIELPRDGELIMLGTPEQRRQFSEIF